MEVREESRELDCSYHRKPNVPMTQVPCRGSTSNRNGVLSSVSCMLLNDYDGTVRKVINRCDCCVSHILT